MISEYPLFGEQGKQVLEAYGDRAVSAVKNLSDADSAKAIQLMVDEMHTQILQRI